MANNFFYYFPRIGVLNSLAQSMKTHSLACFLNYLQKPKPNNKHLIYQLALVNILKIILKNLAFALI